MVPICPNARHQADCECGISAGFLLRNGVYRFDVPMKDLDLRPGEYQIDSMDSVEDTKVRGAKQFAFVCLVRL